MAGIPLHITPLSYIRGDGDQYIVTDFHLRSTDVVKTRWRFENSAGNVYGCYTGGSADDNFCLYGGSASNNAYIRYNGQLVRGFKATNGTIYNIEHGPDGFFANGDQVTSFNAAAFTCSAPMYIFMLPHSSSAKVTARCYGLTVYRDGEQLCNFIPARNELTGEVGFYESVGGVFYENAGTGAFTAGPEVNFSVKTLLLKRRRLMMALIKKKLYDAKIAYLHTGSDNRNAISTGYRANNTDSFVLEVDLNLETSQGSSSYMGSNGNLQIKMSSIPTGRHIVRVERESDNGPRLYVDGTLVLSSSLHTYIGYYIGLFAMGNSASAERFDYYVSNVAIYSASLTINGDLVRDLIPVRVGQVGYLFDQVSEALLGNIGGQTFTLGPDIVPDPLPTELVTEYREYIADADAKTLSTGGNTLAVCQKYVNPAQTNALCLTTAYVTFENNTATGNKARAVWYVKGAPCFYVRGTNSTPVAGNPNTIYDFFYTMGTIIKVYIMKDPTDF